GWHAVDPARAHQLELPGPGADAHRFGRQPVAQRRLFDARFLGGVTQPSLRGARSGRGRGRFGVEAIQAGHPPTAAADDRHQPAACHDPQSLRVHPDLRDDPGRSGDRDDDAPDLRLPGGVRLPPARLRHGDLAGAGADWRHFLAVVRPRVEEPGVSAVQARPLTGDQLIVVPYRKVSAGALATNVILILLGCFFLLPMLWMLFASGLPVSMLVVPVYQMYVYLGWLDSLYTTALFLAASSLPFAVWLMKNFIDAVPVELEHAAAIDGASTFRILRQVVLPLTVPGIAVTAIYTFINAWGAFIIPFVLTYSPDNQPGPVEIYNFMGSHGLFKFGDLAVFSLLFSVPVIVLYLFMSRYFSGAFNFGGAVK